jgi:lipopolysaccharide biosynthesis glycosyltransferase
LFAQCGAATTELSSAAAERASWEVRDCPLEVRFTSYNQSSVKHYEVVAASVLKHNPRTGFQHIITPCLETSRLKRIVEERGGKYRAVVREHVWGNAHGALSQPTLRHWHIPLDNAFAPTKPFICLDDDMLCRGSLQELTTIKKGEFGVVRAVERDDGYFNGGLIVSYPSRDLFERAFRWIFEKDAMGYRAAGNNWCMDEESLVATTKGMMRYFPIKFNFQQKIIISKEREDEEPVIVHSLGNHFYNGDYLDGMERYFQEHREIHASLESEPLHVAWCANTSRDVDFCMSSFLSMQHFCQMKIIAHITHGCDIGEISKDFRRMDNVVFHRFRQEEFAGWNCGKFTYSVFAKFILPYRDEMKDCKKLLMFDNDILVRRDISPVFEYDLQGKPYGAIPVPDQHNWVEWKKRLNIRHHGGGFVLCDVEKLRQFTNIEQIRTVAIKGGNKMLPWSDFAEENLWGHVFKNDWTNVPASYGNTVASMNCHAIHFHTTLKPFDKKIILNGKVIFDGGGQTVNVCGGNHSIYYPEWVNFHERIHSANEYNYSGRATSVSPYYSLNNWEPSRSLFVVRKPLFYCGKVYQIGEEIKLHEEIRLIYLLNGVVAPSN